MTGGRAAAAGLLVALAACAVSSPETQVREALSRLGAAELRGPGAARVVLERVRFADVEVALDGPVARVVAVVEADGRVTLGERAPSLAYVGREVFAMQRCAHARWCLAEDALSSLRGVVAALAEAPRPGRARVLAWQIRVERDEASAGEDLEVVPGAGGAPARARTLFALRRERERWTVAPAP